MADVSDVNDIFCGRTGCEGWTDDDDPLDLRLPTPTTSYRGTTIGRTLVESLDTLAKENKISNELCNKVMYQFDRNILSALGQRPSNRVTFKATRLRTYKDLDGMWTFVFDEVEFRDYYSFANVPKLKVLAIQGQTSVPRARAGKKQWEGEGQSQSTQQ